MPVEKYLARYAEPEAALADRIPARYHAVLVVPALDEPPELLEGFRAALRGARGRVLVVVVINASSQATDQQRRGNQKLWSALQSIDSGAEAIAQHALLVSGPDADWLALDRFSPDRELPRNQGVGLARKLGADLGLSLFSRDRLELPFLFGTDADAVLPAGYFAAAEKELQGPPTLLYPFHHVLGEDAEAHRATEIHELSIRYHALGLSWAGSPYAFTALGSAIAVGTRAYAAVRGVPRRRAGEDFYLVDKLSKLFGVRRLTAAPIALRSRRSKRVPFGTGPRVEQILRTGEARVASVEAFRALGALLSGLDRVSETGEPGALSQPMDLLAPELRRALGEALRDLGLSEVVRDAMAQASGARLRRRLHTFFDGLRTLRLLHALRDAGLADVPWKEALQRAPFLPELGSDPSVALEALRSRERLAPRDLGPALLG